MCATASTGSGAALWPAVILGALWLFRSQLRALLGDRRVKTVKAAGVEVELEPVAKVLKGNVEEAAAAAATSDDPAERERAVEKLQREAAALGRVEAVQQRGLTERQIKARTSQRAYLEDVFSAADHRLANEDLTAADRDSLERRLQARARREVQVSWLDEASFDEIVDRLGPPEQLADEVIEWELGRRQPPSLDEEEVGQ